MSDVLLIALVLWLEARGEGKEGIQAVADVIYNRAQERHMSPGEVVKQPRQFSCLSNKTMDDLRKEVDELMDKAPKQEYLLWAICVGEAKALVQDWPVARSSANHYYNPRLCSPSWGAQLTDVFEVGQHRFGRI